MIVVLVIIGIVISIIVSFINDGNKKREAELRHKEYLAAVEKRRLELINRYGDELGAKLFNEQFFIGMTKQQLLDSKGKQPDKIEKEELKTKTKETWIYGNKSSGDVFIFENELLTKYKDR